MDSLKSYYNKLEIPVKKNLPYKEILSDHRSVFIKPEGSLSSQNELTKPNSFSIFIANCCISGKFKDGDFTTHFQMNHVIPCHMLTRTTLSQRRSFFLKKNSSTKYDEEPNNNVSATLIPSLFILKSVSMLVQKSKVTTKEGNHHNGRSWRFTVADDLKVSSKITSSKESNPQDHFQRFKVYAE